MGQQGRGLSLMLRLRYYRRILPAYVLGRRSQLSFWHDAPEVNEEAHPGTLGQYWMPFTEKADYGGPYDADGIPQLDYRGATGVQYNPIAVAQYGLGNYNLYRRAGDPERLRKFLLVADWLAASLEQNPAGLWVWRHHFDWEYRTLLKAPWRSGLAQGQGVSVLVRAIKETENERYRDAAGLAMASFYAPMHEGGVAFADEAGRTWIEEYIVSPPTHVLNGFIWASWGIYDYWLLTGDADANDLFEKAMDTIAENLPRYDTGYWSLYEQSGVRLRMLASPFYHRLHIAQLRVLHRLTGRRDFQEYADRWETYTRSRAKRSRALAQKAVFKLLYY